MMLEKTVLMTENAWEIYKDSFLKETEKMANQILMCSLRVLVLYLIWNISSN